MRNFFTAEKTTKTLRLSFSILVLLLVFSISVIFLTENSYAAKKVHLAKRTVTMYSGEWYVDQNLINYDGTFITSKVKWRSKKPSVAKISKTGLIKGIRVGTVKMTAKYKGKTYRFTVKVKDPFKGKKPTNLKIKFYEGLKELYISWSGKNLGVADLIGDVRFQVYVSKNGGAYKLYKTTDEWSCEYKNVQKDIKYKFKVRAKMVWTCAKDCHTKFTKTKTFCQANILSVSYAQTFPLSFSNEKEIFTITKAKPIEINDSVSDSDKKLLIKTIGSYEKLGSLYEKGKSINLNLYDDNGNLCYSEPFNICLINTDDDGNYQYGAFQSSNYISLNVNGLKHKHYNVVFE